MFVNLLNNFGAISKFQLFIKKRKAALIKAFITGDSIHVVV